MGQMICTRMEDRAIAGHDEAFEYSAGASHQKSHRTRGFCACEGWGPGFPVRPCKACGLQPCSNAPCAIARLTCWNLHTRITAKYWAGNADRYQTAEEGGRGGCWVKDCKSHFRMTRLQSQFACGGRTDGRAQARARACVVWARDARRRVRGRACGGYGVTSRLLGGVTKIRELCPFLGICAHMLV